MDCPKCQANMEPASFKDVEVDRCTSCGGIWFDLLEHEDLKKLKGAEKVIDTGNAEKGTEMDKVRGIDCPKCHTGMISIHVPDQPHIVYEQCTICYGTFMDAGEFTDFAHLTIADFFRDLLDKSDS